MHNMINIFQPNVGEDSLNNLKSVFASNWLGRGQYVAKFEEQLSSLLGVSEKKIHTISCATDAIFQILRVLSRRVGSGAIIVPSISFPAVASAVIESGLELIICDVNKLDGQIDLASVQRIFSVRNDVVGIFITHYGGSAVDINALRNVIPSDVMIMEDSACALGSKNLDGSSVGTNADFSCWSFDAMKLLVCGEGAAVYIDDNEKLISFKEQCYLGLPIQQKSGIDRSGSANRWWEYELNCHGVRSVFTDISAAIGLPQIDLIQEKLCRKQKIRDYYCTELSNCRNISILENVNVSVSSNYFFTIKSPDRDALALHLKNNNIYSTLRYFPLSRIPLFQPFVFETCANAYEFSEKALNIPIHDSLGCDEIEAIVKAIKAFCKC